MEEVTIILNTTPAMFAHWLETHTQLLPYKSFPTEKGQITLQRARWGGGNGISLVINGIYSYLAEDGETTKVLFPGVDYISFGLIPLSQDRVEVVARCWMSLPESIPGYFTTLLLDIRERWPEATKKIESYLATTVGEMEPESTSDIRAEQLEFTRDDLDLQDKLMRHFTVEELGLLCDDIGLDHERVLIGNSKDARVNSLVWYFKRRNRLAELKSHCSELRPNVNW